MGTDEHRFSDEMKSTFFIVIFSAVCIDAQSVAQ